jgi:hypothetical protein
MLSRASLFLLLVLLVTLPLRAQEDANATGTDVTATEDSRMLVPPPVNNESYPTEGTAQDRSNYLRAGLTFNTAYTDNVLGGLTANPVSDVSYSVWPSIALDETTSRLHSLLTYDPGFTFYQRTSSRNEADQNLGVDLSYRLSPHVTLDLRDSFHKSSNVLNQPEFFSANPVSGSGQPSAINVIPPLADQLNNTGTAELTYQFARNGMVGMSGTFTNLHFPNPAEVPGLYDSSSKGGSAFYNHRLSGKHYIGLAYQYQDLLAYPTGFEAKTQTHTVLFYYTVYLKPHLSLSFFGGPQYSVTDESVAPALRAWSPAAGASLGWQGRQTSVALAYSRMIGPGGGLIGAVHQDTASLSVGRQLTRMWTMSAGANYANNKILEPALLSFLGAFNTGGHTLAGTVSLQRQIGEHFGIGLGYMRVHQSYTEISAISAVPDTNREWVSISYQFSRPMGR